MKTSFIRLCAALYLITSITGLLYAMQQSQEELNHQLYWGAYLGDFDQVKRALEAGASIDYLGESGTALMVACDNSQIVQFLVSQGANIHIKHNNQTVLDKAVSLGKPDVVKMLLDVGAKIYIAHRSRLFGNTPLIHACASEHFKRTGPELIKLLLEVGASINEENNDGDTALMRATYWGNIHAVKYLLTLPELDMEHKNKHGHTAVDIALQQARAVLENHEPSFNTDNKQRYDNYTEIFHLLCKKSNSTAYLLQNTKQLVDAIKKHNQISALEYINTCHLDVNTQDPKDGTTPLMWAAFHGQIEVVKQLLKVGAAKSINCIARQGTVLDYALQSPDAPATIRRTIVLLLLEAGAKVILVEDKNFWTINFAQTLFNHTKDSEYYAIKIDLCKAYIQQCSANTTYFAGLLEASEKVDACIPILADNIALDPEIRRKAELFFITSIKLGGSPCIDILREAGVNIDACDTLGNTALFWATALKQPHLTAYLVLHGASVNVPNLQGNTPLMRAALNNDNQSVSMLLEKGALVNTQNRMGQTALMMAAVAAGNLYSAIAQKIIGGGADQTITDHQGNTAQKWAYLALKYWHNLSMPQRVINREQRENLIGYYARSLISSYAMNPKG